MEINEDKQTLFAPISSWLTGTADYSFNSSQFEISLIPKSPAQP